MKKILKTLAVVLTVMVMSSVATAQTTDTFFYNPNQFNTFASPLNSFQNDDAFFQYILSLYYGGSFGNQGFYNPGTYYYNTGYNSSAGTPGFTYTQTSGSSSSSSSSNSFDRPDVETDSARDVEDDSAELRGEIDMNDARDGIVFFVYGQDEDMIEDVEDDYDEYEDVEDDEENDDFEVERVDSNFDGDDDFEEEVDGLEEDERYYFVLCVEYEDEDDDERLECGSVEDFETDDDNNGNDEEPDVDTISAINIDDDSAELRGDVDMNDFNDGRVFFVWGEDEDMVEEVEDEDRFSDIDEDGDDLQRESVETNFDGNDAFDLEIFNLDDDTEHFFRICVEYEDEDDDDTLECGDVEEFETDN
ncbi:MAG: hypothetical protein MRY57_03805 [Candidatus Pacebacteria bacterium]|nr:hypothetical protein [Candidatus Paceibacterota bacterium]